jgi:hypothetical protein
VPEKITCYGARVPANTRHPDYDANTLVWLRARDVLAGEDAVKAAGERYLPKLASQTPDEYLAYKNRASFFNATARTADGYVGLIFRREPTVKCGAPDERAASVIGKAMAEFAADVDLVGNSLESYAKNVVGEVIGVGRAGTLVDWEEDGEKRAYAVMYRAEQILNWRMERVKGRNVVTLVVLHETVETGGDEFETEMVEQIRVLKLVDLEAATVPRPVGERQPRYVVELWREDNEQPSAKRPRRGKRKWVLAESRTPLRLGKPLPQIPFVFHGAQHALPQIEKLPLADIIAINLDHYRLDADYKHGLHFTALPTAWVSGFSKDSSLRIGSSAAWVTETIGAAAGFLEFKGQGLETFERAMDRDERLMALLGTRMLEAQKRVGESADAIELRQSGENSVLSTLSLSVSNSLTQVLQWVYWWNSTEALPEDIGEDRVLIQLNTDFSNKGMSSEELTAVVAAWQAGAISRETMFDLFRRGEVMPAGRSDEEEKRLAARDATRNAELGTGNNNQPKGPAKAGTPNA